MFVFSPSLLLVAKGFTWYDFIVTFTGCILGITVLAAALSRYLIVEMKPWEQALCVASALLLIAPGLTVSLIGAALVVPVIARQWVSFRGQQSP